MAFRSKLSDAIRQIRAMFSVEDLTDDAGNTVREGDIAAALIALGAKMAKADGFVSTSEIDAFRDVFRAEKRSRRAVARMFNLFRRTTLGFEAYAARIAKRWRANPAVLEDVMDGLFHIAKADGAIKDEELDYLSRVADIFGFSEREFRRIHAAHDPLNADDPYLILGVDPDISDKDLVRAYRRAAAQNHPDSLIARGAPPELQNLAVEKMSAINDAYNRIRAERATELAAAGTNAPD